MQNMMRALNLAYDRDETRGFVAPLHRGGAMAVFALSGSRSRSACWCSTSTSRAGSATRSAKQASSRCVRWSHDHPRRRALFAFAVIYFLGPTSSPRSLSFLSFGSVLRRADLAYIASGAFAFYGAARLVQQGMRLALGVLVILTWICRSASRFLLGERSTPRPKRSASCVEGEPAERKLQARAKA